MTVRKQTKCKVCGKVLYASESNVFKSQIFHPYTCLSCFIWYVNTTKKITFSKLPLGDTLEGEYEACYERAPQKVGNTAPFRCLLPEGHKGCHIAFTASGVIQDAWMVDRGFLGLSIEPEHAHRYVFTY